MNEQLILVVEDELHMQKAIRDTLELEGYEVTTASNGIEGLRVLEHNAPDLILADIMMPEMDGYEFYRTLRQRPEWLHIPFVYVTVRATRDDILKATGMGAEGYLTKPLDAEKLLATVRARLARARRVRQALDAEVDQIKRRLVTVLGHEINTSLSYIRAYLELALEDDLGESHPLLSRALEGVERGSGRLERLANDFLMLIRLDTQQTAAEYRRLAHVHDNVGRVVQGTASQFQDRAIEAGLHLDIQVEEDLPPVELCDPLFSDALARLMDNAIKFSRENGRTVTVRAIRQGAQVIIVVADQGIGIASSDLSRLFQRFHQINREEFEQQGVGLGLAIAHELIQFHGGDIMVESTPGEGSTFTINLPPAARADAFPSSVQPRPAGTEPRTPPRRAHPS